MLTEAEIQAPNTTGRREKRSDGGGLRLVVSPTGRRTWEVAYRFNGQSRTLPLGKYPAVTLAEARYRTEQLRLAVDRGQDPGAGSKRQERERAAVDRARRFDVVAEQWFRTTVESRRDPKYAARVWSRVKADLLPTLGDKAIDEIGRPTCWPPCGLSKDAAPSTRRRRSAAMPAGSSASPASATG